MKSEAYPPKLAQKIFEAIFSPDEREYLLPSINQAYENLKQKQGKRPAHIWYLKQLLRSVPQTLLNRLKRSIAMLKNTLKFSFRNLRNTPGYSLINIIGLTVSMACFILIFLWISDEISYDRFHKNGERIYRVGNFDIDDNDDIYYAVTSAPLAEMLQTRFPEVKKAVRVTDYQGTLEYRDKKFQENRILAASPEFFNIFTFPLLRGDPTDVLKDINSVLLSEATAKKYFADGEAMGRILRLDSAHDLHVTGIFKNIPGNSSLKFDIMIPFLKAIDLNQRYKLNLENFGFNNFFTYILLEKNTDFASLDKKITMLPATLYPQSKNRLALQSILDVHLHSKFSYDRITADKGDFFYVTVFIAIAAFILIISFINYLSLTSARSASRIKEVGLKKLIGAQKSNIIAQFLAETVFMSLTSLLLSFLLISVFLPVFNQLTNKNIGLSLLFSWSFIAPVLGIVLASALIAGLYPALVMSAVNPAKAIKGTIISAGKWAAFRKILVVFQFCLSIILIVSSLFIHGQLKFLKNKKYSFKNNEILHFKIKGETAAKGKLLKNEFLKLPGVKDFTSTSLHSDQLSQFYLKNWQGKTGDHMVSCFAHSTDYRSLKVFNLEMAAGRFFSEQFGSDAGEGIVVNESAVRAMGMDSPLGKTIYLGRSQRKIIGVVKDFNYRSFRFAIDPMIMYLQSTPSRYLYVKVDPVSIKGTLAKMREIWNKHVSDQFFNYNFAEDNYSDSYESEEGVRILFNSFTLLAFFVAVLGLFGLASYLAQQKTKEIGIRKVLGAEVSRIVTMFSREFLTLVAVSNIIAWPVSFLIVKSWLNNFAYRVPLAATVFILAGIITLVLTFLTISYHSLKAARTDPVRTLKYE